MGRVKPSILREGVKVQRGGNVPFFKWEMGKKYRIVFPSVGQERDVFTYMEAVHNLMINGKFTKIRCVNEHYQVSAESKAAVVRYGEDGELATDVASGRQLNDGTCPLCELDYLYRSFVFHEVEKWKTANPGATDKEISAEYKKLFEKSPVQPSAKKNSDGELKIVTTNIILGIVYQLDEKGEYLIDKEDGTPLFDIAVFDFSESRYAKILSIAENNKGYLSDKLKEITDDYGLAWSEFIFDFPVRDEKAQSGKDITITIVPSGFSAIEKKDGLLDKVRAELTDVEKFEKMFEELPSLKVRSIPEIEKELQGRLTQYRDYMSAIEKAELDESLSADEKYLSNEEAENLLNEDLNGGTTAFSNSTESGEDEFLA